jgi:hypothetical protein
MQIAPRQAVGMPKFMATLKEAVARKGGSFVYTTKVKQLIIDAHGRVCGVRALDDVGLRDFMAGAVVLATGGYASNRELLEGFVDPNSDAMVVRGVKWATGDGLVMAREVGPGISNMGGLMSVRQAALDQGPRAAGRTPVPVLCFFSLARGSGNTVQVLISHRALRRKDRGKACFCSAPSIPIF